MQGSLKKWNVEVIQFVLCIVKVPSFLSQSENITAGAPRNQKDISFTAHSAVLVALYDRTLTLAVGAMLARAHGQRGHQHRCTVHELLA